MAAIDLLGLLFYPQGLERGVLLLIHEVTANKIFKSQAHLKSTSLNQHNLIGSLWTTSAACSWFSREESREMGISSFCTWTSTKMCRS